MSEINLHSTMDAQVWTKEFMRLFGHYLDRHIDEGLLICWFANAIMAGYDTAMQRQPGLTGIREVYEKYKHLDGPLSDEYIVADGDYPGHIRRELWLAVKGIFEEGVCNVKF